MPRTLLQIKTEIKNCARDLCDLAYNQPNFSDELAMAAVSLSLTLKYINDELEVKPVVSIPDKPCTVSTNDTGASKEGESSI